MSDDLLAKEKEFRRLNQELQLKTRDVMKEVNSIINTHIGDNIYNTNQFYPTLVEDMKTIHLEDATSNFNKKLKESINISENTLIENMKNTGISLKKTNTLGNNAIIDLLQAKIDMLQKEVQVIQLEYNKKCEHSKELEIENKKLDETQVKLQNQIGYLNNTITKLEDTNSNTLSKYQALSNENVTLKKDLEGLKKEVKTLSQQLTNYNVRLNRSVETNEKLRNTLKCSQMEEKELRIQIRKLQEDKRLAIKNLERQRTELVQAFKKQMLLIDNLKKQNIYLIANGQVRLMEEDFMKLLEWKPQL